MVKISEAINLSQSILKDSIPSPRLDAEIIVCHVLKKDRLFLTINRDFEISKFELDTIKALSHLRASHKPMAYITGIKEFMSLEFTVNENVLIPRPETEELVSLIIEENKGKNLKILDLCTGSGAICVSLAHYIKDSYCVGVDISSRALEIAKINAEKIGVAKRCEFKLMDVLKPASLNEKFDIVVSNPPYIESETVESLDTTVKSFEPRLALDGGDDGLTFYRQITKNISLYLKKGGMLYYEIGYNQGKAVKKLMENEFTNTQIIKDLSGHDRIVKGIF